MTSKMDMIHVFETQNPRGEENPSTSAERLIISFKIYYELCSDRDCGKGWTIHKHEHDS